MGLSHADEVALAQWSVVDGLLVQKLRAGGGEREVYEEKRGLKRACLDSSVNIINAQWACRREGGVVDGMLYPVTRGFPGGGLMRGRRILFEIDVKDLQERICGGEDEIGGNLRICRADMRDIASVIQSREKDATEGMEEEDEEEGEEDGAFDGLLREFSGGVMLDEVCRSVRAGMAHGETAMGVEGLRGGIEDAGSVELEEVTWHESCRRGGHGVGDCYTGVHTGDELPDWVLTTVYFMKKEEGGRKEEEKEDGGFVHGGLYHDLFVRMKHYFFE